MNIFDKLPASHQSEGGRRQCCSSAGRVTDAQRGPSHGLSRSTGEQHGQGRERRFREKLEIPGRRFQRRGPGQGREHDPRLFAPINYPIPDQIKVTVEENTKLDHRRTGQTSRRLVASELALLLPAGTLTRARAVRYVGDTSNARKARRFSNN